METAPVASAPTGYHATARMLQALDDDALWRISSQGDGAAFEVLVARHASGIHGYLRRLGAPREDALDLRQETFLRAHRFRSLYSSGSLRSWFRTLARNVFYDWTRGRARREVPTISFPDPPDQRLDVLHELEREERVGRLERVARIVLSPNECRVILCRLRGLSNPEISLETGISAKAVRVHACNGLKRLRQTFGHPTACA